MTCVICRIGTTAPGASTSPFDAGGTTIVIRNVPGDVCDACGEA